MEILGQRFNRPTGSGTKNFVVLHFRKFNKKFNKNKNVKFGHFDLI